LHIDVYRSVPTGRPGRVKKEVDPFPTSDSTQMLPAVTLHDPLAERKAEPVPGYRSFVRGALGNIVGAAAVIALLVAGRRSGCRAASDTQRE